MRKTFLIAAACLSVSCIKADFNRDLLAVISEDHQLKTSAYLTFENSSGDLEIIEWDNDFTRIETSIYGDSATGVPEDLQVNIIPSPDGIDCSVDYPNGMYTCSVDFLVTVPKNSDLTIESATVNGDIEIIADADVLVETVNGDITLEVFSSSGLSTTNGDIRAELAFQSSSVVIETVNGDVDLTLPAGLSVAAETVNGDISFMEEIHEDRLDIEGSGIETIRIETVNGDVSLSCLEE